MDGASLLHELLHGGHLPEGVDDGAAREGNVGAARAACDERGAGDVDVAESPQRFCTGRIMTGARTQPCRMGRMMLRRRASWRAAFLRMRRISLSSRSARQERTYSVVAGRFSLSPAAVWTTVSPKPFAPLLGTSARMSAAAGSLCMRISLFVRFISDLLSYPMGGLPPLLPAAGAAHRHEYDKSITRSFLNDII